MDYEEYRAMSTFCVYRCEHCGFYCYDLKEKKKKRDLIPSCPICGNKLTPSDDKPEQPK